MLARHGAGKQVSGPAGEDQSGVLRRKLTAARAARAEGGAGADRAWRIALARAARDTLKLPLEVTALLLDRRSLAELLELPPERSLIAVLEGPGDGLGVLILSPEVLSGFIENLTIGRISAGAVPARRPTRTDAAMVAVTVDAALIGLERALAEEADLYWAGGFRYASFLDDHRSLGLLLEDIPYRLLCAEVSLALGARSGTVMLALPAVGRGWVPPQASARKPPHDHGPAFAEALAERVAGAACVLVAVVARLTMPLSAVMSLDVGQLLALPQAALDRITLEGVDGRRVAGGKLGQNRGMRAVRLAQLEGGAEGAAEGGMQQARVATAPDPVSFDPAPMAFDGEGEPGQDDPFLMPTGTG